MASFILSGGVYSHRASAGAPRPLRGRSREAGVFAIIIDGVGDFVSDVNDPVECNALTAELQDLAIRYDCPVVAVLHENPTQKSGKARGHLGSQLERKAETVLRLKRKKEVIVIYAEKTRGAPLTEKAVQASHWTGV